MREILFRGFHPDKNGSQKVFVDGKWIKGFWVYGYYTKRRGAINAGFANPTNIIEDNETGIEYDVIPSTVGQYTGLTDKNGTKVFVGDVCKFYIDDESYIAPVHFDDNLYKYNFCSFYKIDGVYHVIKFDIQKAENIEVISNIYSDHEESR